MSARIECERGKVCARYPSLGGVWIEVPDNWKDYEDFFCCPKCYDDIYDQPEVDNYIQCKEHEDQEPSKHQQDKWNEE